MNFTLKPDDNGVTVVLTNVNEADVSALEKASKHGFDPTATPFDRYYAYDKSMGFFVDKDYFDHAEYKGKRLSFDEYVKMLMPTSASDAEYDFDFIAKRILDMKVPKDVKSANAALATLNFSLFKLQQNIADAKDEQKAKYHDVIDHAFDIYAKAAEILSGSEFEMLADLKRQLDQYLNISASAQSSLLQKFNENF